MTYWGYQTAYSFFWLISFTLIPFSRKLRLGILGRQGLEKRLLEARDFWKIKALNSSPYWFHFASAGELEQAIPIAEELKRRDPKAAILFTFFSPSGEKAIRLETERRKKGNRSLPWDAADYLPFDLPWKVERVLDIVRPKALILINRELWPVLILKTHQRSVPIFLFSSFFPPQKIKMLSIWRPYLKYLKQIGTVGDSSTALLLQTDPALKVKSIGDTRIERVLERKSLQPSPPAWGSFLENRSLLIGASLWNQDFEALKPAIQKVVKDFPNWRICLVPHEPEESLIHKIKTWGKEQNISFRRFSQFLQIPDEVSPLIVDQVGLLAELYRYSSLAFVGGSFKARVHNVLEPAAYSNAIVVGPHIQNSFEATEMARLKKGLESVSSSKEALDSILKRVSDVSFLKSEGEAAYKYLLNRCGSAAKYCDLL